jgi:2-keto-4-pentenoate hydratase/2-oxohepta-3-ene-1,7-dioic acid hydratase in catechol pathway
MATYKLATCQTSKGKIGPALVVGNNVFPFANLPDFSGYLAMLDLLEDWLAAEPKIAFAAARLQNGQGGEPASSTVFLAPVLYPSAIYCAGANYGDHVLEMALAKGRQPPPDPHTLGLPPWHFLKSPRSITGPNTSVKMPAHTKKLDWEIELAAVIGRPAKDVPLARALDFVAGYTIANDLSARDLSIREAVQVGSGFRHDWIGQKCFDGACPLGPWIVPAKQIPNPQKLALKLSVNGVVKQDSNTSEMIFTLAEQISHLSSCITLYPGDLILTGSPAGVGIGRGEFLKPGDKLELSIESIGTLNTNIT